MSDWAWRIGVGSLGWCALGVSQGDRGMRWGDIRFGVCWVLIWTVKLGLAFGKVPSGLGHFILFLDVSNALRQEMGIYCRNSCTIWMGYILFVGHYLLLFPFTLGSQQPHARDSWCSCYHDHTDNQIKVE